MIYFIDSKLVVVFEKTYFILWHIKNRKTQKEKP